MSSFGWVLSYFKFFFRKSRDFCVGSCLSSRGGVFFSLISFKCFLFLFPTFNLGVSKSTVFIMICSELRLAGRTCLWLHRAFYLFIECFVYIGDMRSTQNISKSLQRNVAFNVFPLSQL